MGVFIIFGLVAVVFVAILFFVVRSFTGGSRNEWRTGEDGFFIVGDYSQGDEVEYEALVSGGWKRGVIPCAGRETFVYTGIAPTDVRVLGVVGQGRVSSPPSSGPDVPDDDVFTGTPTAY